MKKKKVNIVYIVPAHKSASGGSKVIYQHSELINKFKIDNVSSHILHLKKKKIDKFLLSLKKRMFNKQSKKYGWYGNEMKPASHFKPSSSWIKNKVLTKNDMNFNSKTDFVIIPEIWAHFASHLLIKKKNQICYIRSRYICNEFIP